MGSESSGFQQGSGDVVGEVAEPQGGASEVFEAAVDRLCGAVGGAGPVEIGQDVVGASGQGPAQFSGLDQHRRDALAEAVDHGLHQSFPLVWVWFAVRGDDPLIDTPGGFDLRVFVRREQHHESCPLSVG